MVCLDAGPLIPKTYYGWNSRQDLRAYPAAKAVLRPKHTPSENMLTMIQGNVKYQNSHSCRIACVFGDQMF